MTVTFANGGMSFYTRVHLPTIFGLFKTTSVYLAISLVEPVKHTTNGEEKVVVSIVLRFIISISKTSVVTKKKSFYLLPRDL
jgi:hypothetical protein